MVLSIAFHAAFIAVAEWAVDRRAAWLDRPPSMSYSAGVLSAVSLWLLASMSATVWIWALYFLWAGTLGDLETSVYFSIVSFTTLGFGDIVLDRPHRILSGMLAANGLLLLGLTMAVLIDLIRTIHAEEFGPAGSNGWAPSVRRGRPYRCGAHEDNEDGDHDGADHRPAACLPHRPTPDVAIVYPHNALAYGAG